MKKNKSIKLSDIFMAVIVFVLVVALSIAGILERQYQRKLLTTVDSLQTQLEQAESENRIHEQVDVNTEAINHFFKDATGQIIIERVMCTGISEGSIYLMDTHGKQWTIPAPEHADKTYLQEHELLMFVDSQTPEDHQDDIVIAVYVKEE